MISLIKAVRKQVCFVMVLATYTISSANASGYSGTLTSSTGTPLSLPTTINISGDSNSSGWIDGELSTGGSASFDSQVGQYLSPVVDPDIMWFMTDPQTEPEVPIIVPGIEIIDSNGSELILSFDGLETSSCLFCVVEVPSRTGVSVIYSEALGALSSLAVVKAAPETAPESSGGTLNASLASQSKAFKAIGTRVGRVRTATADSGTGIAAGGTAIGLEGWVKAFASTAEQDARRDSSGYDLDNSGFALGFDRKLLDHRLTLGLAYSYTETDIDEKGDRLGNGTEVTSNQAAVYGSYMLSDDYFIDGTVGIAHHSYDGLRNVSSLTAQADYDGIQYSAELEGGYNHRVGGFSITPTIGLHYSHIALDDYTETGAGLYNLSVEEQNYDVLETKLGVKAAYLVSTSAGTLTPEVRASWAYDVIGDEQSLTSNFTGGGSAFTTTSAKAQKHTRSVGFSLEFETESNVTFTSDIDATYKDEYSEYTGQFTVRYAF